MKGRAEEGGITMVAGDEPVFIDLFKLYYEGVHMNRTTCGKVSFHSLVC